MNGVPDQIRNDHHQFDKGQLGDVELKEPFTLFAEWLKKAAELPAKEPNAMALTTVDTAGTPHSRIVYLREMVDETFVFYTNYNSDKGRQIEGNPSVHLLFFWPELERQIRISGKAEKVSETISDAYFSSRPRGSKLGAWASHQSEVLGDRSELESRLEKLSEQYPDEVPRPSHWGGYRVVPSAIEFWQGRPSRLHDRIQFEKSGESWKIYRKNP